MPLCVYVCVCVCVCVRAKLFVCLPFYLIVYQPVSSYIFIYFCMFLSSVSPCVHPYACLCVRCMSVTFLISKGWSGDAMVLGKLPVRDVLLIWLIVGLGPTALAVGAGGGCVDIFLLSIISLLYLPLSVGDGPI